MTIYENRINANIIKYINAFTLQKNINCPKNISNPWQMQIEMSNTKQTVWVELIDNKLLMEDILLFEGMITKGNLEYKFGDIIYFLPSHVIDYREKSFSDILSTTNLDIFFNFF